MNDIKEFDNLYPCEVIDNNDPNQSGRVQVSILNIGTGFNPNHLHWVRPKSAFLGGSTDSGESRIPEIGSKLFVTFEKPKQLRNGYYIWDIDLKNFSIHAFFGTNIKSSIVGQEISTFSSSYPNVKFKLYKNGICQAISSDFSNKEIVTYHPEGAITYINNAGDMLFKSPTKINIESGSNDIELALLGETTNNTLDSIMTNLINALTQSVTMFTAINAAVMGGALTPNITQMTTDVTNLSSNKATLPNNLSSTFKHN